MPIPQDILSVTRPKNTVVIAYGKDKSLYAVRQRVGCRNDNGRHLPVNGPTIGHIIDGVYVPIDQEAPDRVSASPVDLKDWANIVLCDRLFSDIRKELSAVYSHQLPFGALSRYRIVEEHGLYILERRGKVSLKDRPLHAESCRRRVHGSSSSDRWHTEIRRVEGQLAFRLLSESKDKGDP